MWDIYEVERRLIHPSRGWDQWPSNLFEQLICTFMTGRIFTDIKSVLKLHWKLWDGNLYNKTQSSLSQFLIWLKDLRNETSPALDKLKRISGQTAPSHWLGVKSQGGPWWQHWRKLKARIEHDPVMGTAFHKPYFLHTINNHTPWQMQIILMDSAMKSDGAGEPEMNGNNAVSEMKSGKEEGSGLGPESIFSSVAVHLWFCGRYLGSVTFWLLGKSK